MTPEEIEKLRLAIAERAHQNETEFGKAANLAAVNSETETLREILFINGGACVAMFAFVGTLATGNRLNPEMVNRRRCEAGSLCLLRSVCRQRP